MSGESLHHLLLGPDDVSTEVQLIHLWRWEAGEDGGDGAEAVLADRAVGHCLGIAKREILSSIRLYVYLFAGG